MEIQLHTHEFPPVYDENSRILILGSFPSVKSREQQFFYGHPRNRFWPLLAAIYQEIVPVTVEEKKAFLLYLIFSRRDSGKKTKNSLFPMHRLGMDLFVHLTFIRFQDSSR